MDHCGYGQREPVEVRINPDGIEIVSYPGPDPSIRPTDLKAKRIVSRRYRNRRIGEFFKELEMTEGRGTGIPKIRAAMKRNGSPKAKFKTDDLRLWFRVELPVHPKMRNGQAHVQAHVEAHVEAHVLNETAKRIMAVLKGGPLATNQITEALGHTGRSGAVKLALTQLESSGLIELTIPDKPRSRNQMRRLTSQGNAWLSQERGAKSES